MDKTSTAISFSASQSIKGIALIMMVFHHAFAFPSWFVDASYAEPMLQPTALGFKLCVCIFAFLTGWTYYHHQDKSNAYTLRKIVSIMLDYAVLVIVTMLLAVSLCNYHLSIDNILHSFIPLTKNTGVMFFAWYIGFYIIFMLLLPYVDLAGKDMPKIRGWILVCVVYGFISGSLVVLGRAQLAYWLPCPVLGYFCAKFGVLEYLSNLLKKRRLCIVVALLMLVASVWLYYLCGCKLPKYLHVGVVLAIPFCLGGALLSPVIKKIKLDVVLSFLSKHSINIWLLHGIFFDSQTRDFFQPLAYAVDSPLYVVAFILGSCTIVSIILLPIQRRLSRFVINGILANK